MGSSAKIPSVELNRTLRGRHLTMISIGGIVGAGLGVAPLSQWVTAKYPQAFQPMRSGAHRYSSIIRAYGYLRRRWHSGELSMPKDADVDTFFGRAKKLKEA